ncbi:MAG: hypothetical protein ACPL28_05980 [bacterium]
MLSIIHLFGPIVFSANFAICTDTSQQYYATTIFANSQYYVFWADYRYYSSQGLYSLYGARVTSAGTVLDPNGKLLFKRQAAYEPRVAFDGTNFLVAIRDSC